MPTDENFELREDLDPSKIRKVLEKNGYRLVSETHGALKSLSMESNDFTIEFTFKKQKTKIFMRARKTYSMHRAQSDAGLEYQKIITQYNQIR